MRTPLPIRLPLASSLLLASAALAAPPGRDPAAAPLYQYWYTVSSAGQPAQYYSEKVELRERRVWLLNQIWKKDGDFINEEQLGVVAENSGATTPVLFNFRGVYRGRVTQIDGTFKEGGRSLSVTIRNSGQEPARPPLTRRLPVGILPSGLFPFWLSRRLPALKEGQTTSLQVVMEDNIDLGFQPVVTTVRREKNDDYAARTQSVKLKVKSSGAESTWWVDPEGAALRIENPSLKLVVERVSEPAARRFLDRSALQRPPQRNPDETSPKPAESS